VTLPNLWATTDEAQVASAPVTVNHHSLATAWSSAQLSSLPLTFPLLTQRESLQTIVSISVIHYQLVLKMSAYSPELPMATVPTMEASLRASVGGITGNSSPEVEQLFWSKFLDEDLCILLDNLVSPILGNQTIQFHRSLGPIDPVNSIWSGYWGPCLKICLE
jgi:hypothetical protein